MLTRTSAPHERSWLSEDDRSEGKLAFDALTALRKTFTHWMLLARFFYKMQQLADMRAQGKKRTKNSFRVLLEINGFDRDTVEQNLGGEKGGWSTVSRLIKIGIHADAVQTWYDAEKPDLIRVNAPTTIIKHCPAIPKASRGTGQPPRSHRDLQLSKAKEAAAASAEAKRLKRENEQLLEEVKEVREELQGAREANSNAPFSFEHDEVKAIGSKLMEVDRAKAIELANWILEQPTEPTKSAPGSAADPAPGYFNFNYSAPPTPKRKRLSVEQRVEQWAKKEGLDAQKTEWLKAAELEKAETARKKRQQRKASKVTDENTAEQTAGTE
jgi:hypothetical protein